MMTDAAERNTFISTFDMHAQTAAGMNLCFTFTANLTSSSTAS
jgi:hypothetical protein